MNLRQLLAALPSLETPLPADDPDITLITADSRQVIPGALFVAYPGVSVDSHRFIPQAIERGAVAIIGEREIAQVNRQHLHRAADAVQVSTINNQHYIQVRSGSEAFAWLNAAWHGYPARQLIMIGVTGTGWQDHHGQPHPRDPHRRRPQDRLDQHRQRADRRARVRHRLAHHHARRRCRAALLARDGGRGHDAWCAGDHLARAGAPPRHRLRVEYSRHHQHHARAPRRARFAQSVSGREGAAVPIAGDAADKGVPKAAILNLDDSSYPYLRAWIEQSAAAAQRRLAIYSYAVCCPADCAAIDIDYRADAIYFKALCLNKQIEIATPLVGEYNVLNCLAAMAATVLGLAIDPAPARAGLAAMAGIPGRMERIHAGQAFTAIVDFAHTPNALDRAIAAARQMTDGRVIVAFGCAGLRDREKRALMGEVASRAADKIIITAEDPRTESLDEIMAVTAAAIQEQGRTEGVDFWRVPDRGEALAFACSLARPGDVVLACGKGHEQSMCFGDIEYPWDDREALRAAIKGTPLKTLPTANV